MSNMSFHPAFSSPARLYTVGRMCIAVLLCLLAPGVFGQTAPEGNAHPATQNVAPGGATQASPFGPHNTDTSRIDTASQKAAFAAALDLEPLRSLSVFHNGRAKVLETLAGETVSKISGRRTFVDFIKTPRDGGGEDVKDIKYDPMFTLMDMTIDPAYYLDKALIAVEYLPLREAVLEAEYPGDENASLRERWKKVGRVTPFMIDRHLGAVLEAHSGSEQYVRSAARVDDALQMFMQCRANFMVVAPAALDATWQNLASLEPTHPVRIAAMDLGKAWREHNAAGVNAAVAVIAAELPKINASVYPTTKRTLEVLYNKSHAFEWGYWAYFVSLVLLLLAFGTGRSWLAGGGVVVLAAALSLHALGFILRCMIAERFAIQNQFESMTGLSLFAATVGTVVMIWRRQWLFGAAAASVGFMVLLTATQAGIPGGFIEREAAILNTSSLLKYHVTTVLVSYGLISLGFVCSLFYLASHYARTQEVSTVAVAGGGSMAVGTGGGTSRAKLLGELDAAQMIV
ncbi:MAG: hypothetical protein NTV94_17875, partial [Planctomycetota bacterium]|nr:hypothetical protein [Planctomycetota bacterium]